MEKWNGFLIETRDTLAAMIEQAIVFSFPRSGPGWAKLHPFTVKIKGSSAVLVDTGQLRNSIMIDPNDIGSLSSERKIGVFVAHSGYHVDQGRFPQTKRTNITVAAIAQIHEFGAVITVTPRMRRFLHAAGIHLKKSTGVIVIPERSFLRKGWDQVESELFPTIVESLNLFFLQHAIDVT